MFTEVIKKYYMSFIFIIILIIGFFQSVLYLLKHFRLIKKKNINLKILGTWSLVSINLSEPSNFGIKSGLISFNSDNTLKCEYLMTGNMEGIQILSEGIWEIIENKIKYRVGDHKGESSIIIFKENTLI